MEQTKTGKSKWRIEGKPTYKRDLIKVVFDDDYIITLGRYVLNGLIFTADVENLNKWSIDFRYRKNNFLIIVQLRRDGWYIVVNQVDNYYVTPLSYKNAMKIFGDSSRDYAWTQETKIARKLFAAILDRIDKLNEENLL